MISLVEALNFRCLRFVHQPLRQFQVLVGPNASGKTTFLDVVAFLSRLVSDGLESAVGDRTQNFVDLLWGRAGSGFELAIEARIPEPLRQRLANSIYDTIRYEIGIGFLPGTSEIGITSENGRLKVGTPYNGVQRSFFPSPEHSPESIFTGKLPSTRSLFTKTLGGNDNYYADAHPKEGRWAPAFKLGTRKSTLGNLPEDESNFPVSTWFKQFIGEGVQQIILNSLRIRRASPPGQERGFKPDGSNLPWVVADLERNNSNKFRDWIAHLRTALPDLEHIRTIVREDDRHCYLMLRYAGGLEVPSWMASDGTLRLLALTLPAYLDNFRGVYLIEEPENGIHPRAVETMCQSLSSVYEAQISLATHSPVILSVVDAADVLCFAKTPDGATDIVPGNSHPKLRDWQGQTNLGELFAAGVLG